MCGIAGAIGLCGHEIESAVKRMKEALVHRGPDDQGLFKSEINAEGQGVLLAHQRLSILDVSSAAAQPMHDLHTGDVLTYNGEVYNFAQLRESLGREPSQWQSTGDTEVVFKAMHQWKASAPTHFNGMFAFAYYESSKQRVYLVRDRLGIKPLYYAHVNDGKTLLFASEVRALLASNLIARTLDPVSLSTYLWNGFVVGPNTIVKDIKLLPAGSLATVQIDDPKIVPTSYWELPDQGDRTSNPSDVQDALNESVEKRMCSDVPLGVFLSGGVDSSAVTAMAVKASESPVSTFNIAFEESNCDESAYAEAVAKSLGTDHSRIVLTETVFAQQLESAMASLDQPTFDGINTYFVSRAVREAGLTVALAGTGGDELFGGYTSFAEVPRAAAVSKRLGVLPGSLSKTLARSLMRIKSGRPGVVPPQTRWGKLSDVFEGRGDLVATFQISYALYTTDFIAQLSHRQTVVEYGLNDLDQWREKTRNSSNLFSVSTLELAQFIGQRLLRDTDSTSMAVSLEVRLPLLDHNVVEMVAGLDDQTRFSPLGRKQMLRDLALSDLDPSIFERPKSGFVMPIDQWCRRSLSNMMTEVFEDEDLCRSVGLEPRAVRAIWRAFCEGSPGIYWSRVWAIFSLMWWCRLHRVELAS